MGENILALRIRAFRKLKGYTQHELAVKLGVSVAILGAVERGMREPDDKLLANIARTLNVEVAEICGQK